MKAILSLLVFVGSVSALVGDEFFANYVKTFVNQSVAPCDNFYRYVCSRNMQNTDRYRGHAMSVIEGYIRDGDQMLEQTRNITLFEKILKGLGPDYKKAYYRLLFELQSSDDLIAKGYEVLHTFSSLQLRMHYVTGMSDLSSFAPRELMHEIIEFTEAEIQATNPQFEEDTIRKLRKTLATLNSERYDEFSKGIYESIFDSLNEFFVVTGELDMYDELNAKTHFGDILRVLGKYAPALLSLKALAPSLRWLPKRITEANAGYYPDNSVLFHDYVFVISANASIPAKLGTAGRTMSHEMFHSILEAENWNSDQNFGRHMFCLESHMQNVCGVFQEGECHSGPATYTEDGPDMEAAQLTYKLMRSKLGDKVKEPFRDTTVTNEQLFFIANAMFACEQEDANGKLNHAKDPMYDDWDTHSYGPPRVNGPLSLMKAFHEAFDCKAGDRMFDVAVNREDCNAFGEPVRK